MLAEREGACFLIVDFQERLAPHISGAEAIEANLIRLCHASRVLNVPLVFTEQYPQGLGPTVESLRPFMVESAALSKVSFGCLGDPGIRAKLEGAGVRTLFVAGIEAHVCVMQTCLQAIEQGFTVHVISDAVGSRNPSHVALALNRISKAGGIVSCVEMALFELAGVAGTGEFKEIQKLIKG